MTSPTPAPPSRRPRALSITVHPSFIVVALLGYPAYTGWEIAAWTGAVFIAVLLHELGHAVAALAFGARPVAVTLFALGGYTTYPAAAIRRPLRRFVVAAAGSTVGIAAGGAVWAAARSGFFDGLTGLPVVFLESFFFASFVWGILNWLPIGPLDGAAMIRSLLDAVAPRAAPMIARGISVAVGSAAALFAWQRGWTFAAFFVVFLMVSGLRDEEPSRPRRRDPAAEPPPRGGLGI